MTTITATNLYPCFNCGTPNAKQLAMFGMKWPLRHGWAREMIGRQVPDDFLGELASLRKRKGNQDPLAVNLPDSVSDEWGTIDSAPKDGTKILLVDNSGCIAVAKWDIVSMGGEYGWQINCTSTDWNYYESMDHPTHWMPIPPLPYCKTGYAVH